MQQNLAIKGNDLLIQSGNGINLIFIAEWKKPNKLTYSMSQWTQIYRTGKTQKHLTVRYLEDDNKNEKFFMFRKLKLT